MKCGKLKDTCGMKTTKEKQNTKRRGYIMNCPVCGAVVPEGSATCPVCGAQLAQQPGQTPPQQSYEAPLPVTPQPVTPQPITPQPVTPQPVQPGFGAQQANYGAQGFGVPTGTGIGASMAANMTFSKLLQLIGAFFIMISPFFHWLSVKVSTSVAGASNNNKMSANMFGMEKSSFVFFGIIIIFAGAVLLCFELADYFPQLNQVKAKVSAVPYIELIIIGVAIVFALCVFFNDDVSQAIKMCKTELKSAKELASIAGVKVSGHANRGLGPIVFFLGVICAACPRVMKLMNKDLDQMVPIMKK